MAIKKNWNQKVSTITYEPTFELASTCIKNIRFVYILYYNIYICQKYINKQLAKQAELNGSSKKHSIFG